MEINNLTGKKVNHLILDKRIDLSGETFCHLRALRPDVVVDDSIESYVCQCMKCGKIISVKADDLFFYKTRSCGCTDHFDLIGGVFSRLTVIRQAGIVKVGKPPRSAKLYLCRCICGNELKLTSGPITSRHAKSCGCLKLDQATKYVDPIDRKINHRLSIIKSRCCNPSDAMYHNYGARGITVCDEWMADTQNFVTWFKSQPNWNIKLEVDRIDGTGPYAPWNCRLATRETQLINRRVSHFLVVDGIKLTGSDWSSLLRLKNRSSVYSYLQHNGPEKTIAMIRLKLKEFGINQSNLHDFIQFEHFDPITKEENHV